eukprot:6510126-Pyramimonas_sp.AAC.1
MPRGVMTGVLPAVTRVSRARPCCGVCQRAASRDCGGWTYGGARALASSRLASCLASTCPTSCSASGCRVATTSTPHAIWRCSPAARRRSTCVSARPRVRRIRRVGGNNSTTIATVTMCAMPANRRTSGTMDSLPRISPTGSPPRSLADRLAAAAAADGQ